MAKLYETRLDMVKDLLFPGCVLAEVGVFEGTFAEQLLQEVQPGMLWLVDPWQGISGSGDQDGNNFKLCNLETEYQRLVCKYHDDPRVSIQRMFSVQFYERLADNSLDALYIDGDHSYQGVRTDLLLGWNKVKPGGWIMGHDYEINMDKANVHYDFGVERAVQEFLADRGLSLHAKGLDGCVSFAFQKPIS